MECETDIFYEVKRIDKRVSLIDVEVKGAFMTGVLRTFFRPPPVDQPAYKWISDQVIKDEFSNQYALVIGGSRGVGETTAKTIAAGGGEVLISYNSGFEDAQRVMSEIVELGGKCQIIALNVLDKAPLTDSVLSKCFTHLYYFASPRIASNSSVNWDGSKYDQYIEYYVESFAKFVDEYSYQSYEELKKLTVFYPSTIYIDDTPRGFFEYAAAKNTGEYVCKKLNLSTPNLRCIYARLPKMETDQTASLIRSGDSSISTFKVIYKELQIMDLYEE